MKIIDIKIGRLSIPLLKSFKTALRSLNVIENVVVKIVTDTGQIGYGGAAPTEVITGDTIGSIIGGIEHIKPHLIGKKIENFEYLMVTLNQCLVKNTSAKAAIDIALYDLFGQLYKAPIYKLLGGYRNKLSTDLTISINEPEEMAIDSLEAVKKGCKVLKIKVGKNADGDIKRLKAIRDAIGYDIKLRVDANQGWKPKEAVLALRKMEDIGLKIELAEQPVKAHDIEGLRYVTENVSIPILADESVFSPLDAMNIISQRAADMINIKLMKTGGIYNALKIIAMAEAYGIECMIGSMMESKIGITAAAHLAAAKSNIIDVDLDVPLLCSKEPVEGGIIYDKFNILFCDAIGFGFDKIKIPY